MLLRFGVQNYYSVNGKEELSLVTSPVKESGSAGLISIGDSEEKIVPSTVIYGANASGKTNFLLALHFIRRAVVDSQNSWKPERMRHYTPFLLDQQNEKHPSLFDIDFLVGGVRYHYEFAVGRDGFLSESLDCFAGANPQKLFDRRGNDVEHSNLEGTIEYKNSIITAMRKNSLFLSAAAQQNHPILLKIANFFENITIDWKSKDKISDMDDKTRLRTVNFLNGIGVGIDDICIEEVVLTEAEQTRRKRFLSALGAALVEEGNPPLEGFMDSEKDISVSLLHKRIDGVPVSFSLGVESEGTRKVLPSLQRIWDALEKGSLLVMDDFGCYLHTRASEAILELFASHEMNPKGAQLIAITHDACLLSSPFLANDSIWLVEKDEYGATHVTPLTDFHLNDDDNRRDGYLQGRFGAVPFAGSVSSLVGRLQ